ncbi:MAG: SDR family NAD(P)-dependent oxidoreductase, partial [Burkholderiales bacterium]
MMRFENKTALVSGAGGPMGAAIARRLASEGARLILTDISGRRLAEHTSAIQREFPQTPVFSQRSSVLDRAEVGALLKAAATFGHVDVLVNVVGGVRGGMAVALEHTDEARWTGTFDLNLNGIEDLDPVTERRAAIPLPQRLDQLLACRHADLPRHVVPLPPDNPTGSKLREATGQL